jgi:hypothetical protein
MEGEGLQGRFQGTLARDLLPHPPAVQQGHQKGPEGGQDLRPHAPHLAGVRGTPLPVDPLPNLW